MRRTVLTLFGALALLLSLGASAGAQDMNCADFNGDGDAAQAYFIQNGGSPTNNVDGLDRDNDGTACDDLPRSGGGGATNPTAPVADDTATTGGTTTTDSGGTSTLPATGTGPVNEAGILTASLMGASALVLAGSAMFVRRMATDRS